MSRGHAVRGRDSLLGGPRRTSVVSSPPQWTHSGPILQLRRGVYLLCSPYAKASAHTFAVAGALKKASYVSLHSALAYHGMIPEFVPVTNSVTSGRPEEIETPYGRFSSVT